MTTEKRNYGMVCFSLDCPDEKLTKPKKKGRGVDWCAWVWGCFVPNHETYHHLRASPAICGWGTAVITWRV